MPSGLLIAVTAHISTDVAAVPLLWVAPLALYLLTFVIAFQTRPIIPHRFVVAIQPIVIFVLIVLFLALQVTSTVGLIALHLIVLFVCALMCHGELARRRPPPGHLTAFYMWISAGGMIGGIAAGLIAPHVFNGVVEYPILIALALLCRPGLAWPQRGSGQILLLTGLAIAFVLAYVVKNYDVGFDFRMYLVMIGVLIGLTAKFWRATLPFAAIMAFLLFANAYFNETPSVTKVRNFFGVLNVVDTSDGKYRVLWHGTTAQGTQQVRDEEGNSLTGPPEMIAEFFEGRRDRADPRCRARKGRREADRFCGGRARHGCARLPGAGGRHADVLRTRSGRRPHRDRPEDLSICLRVRAADEGRARRCAPTPRGRAGRELRPDFRRRIHRRRNPDPSADARSDRDVFHETQAERHRGDAHLKSQSGAFLGRGRYSGSKRRNRPDL